MAYKQLKLWFDKDLAITLADKLKAVEPGFPKSTFVTAVDNSISELELKDRVEAIADQLYNCLGQDYIEGVRVLLQILGPENKEETGMFLNFYWIMPIAKFVEKYGLEYFDLSMQAIKEITKRNTGEYAIRPYLEVYTDKTLALMLKWSKDTNKHVRRLACEGLRPRLPWAKKLPVFIADPSLIIPILRQLKDDKSKYVQKSVANCINDILKDNEEVGKALITSWNQATISKERKWIIKHALRNMLKAKDDWAMEVVA